MRRIFREMMTKPLTRPTRTGLTLVHLEDRVVPATFTVTNTDDAGTGSLRQAILDANTAAGADDIVFDASFNTAKTINITSGQLTVTGDTTITGKGAALTTIKSAQTSSATSRALTFTGGVSVVSGVTITGGNTLAANGGGVSVAAATVTFTNSIITGNTSTVRGGGIAVTSTIGKLTLDRTSVTGNSGSKGGGVDLTTTGTLNLIDSTISGNTTTSSGGGIYFFNGGTFNATRSTISGNTGGSTATSYGGGVYFYGAVTANIVNSTISGNTAARGGGIAIFSANTIVNIRNSTITANNNTLATAGNPAGGISRFAAAVAPGLTRLESTIVAGNITANATSSPDVNITGGAIFADNSLIGSSDGLTTITGSGNKTGTNAAPQAAGLSALADNGGFTKTHALLPGSAALNVGSNSLGLTTDQRGENRSFGAGVDIGAFEFIVTGIPLATASSANVTLAGGTSQAVSATFTDPSGSNKGIVVSGIIGKNDVLTVTGPNSFTTTATYVNIDNPTDGAPRTATYFFTPPGNTWGAEDNGTYNILLGANKVADLDGNFIDAGKLGSFTVSVPQNFVVTNTNDSGAGSLRQAILDSNAASGIDTITFDSSFNTPQTISISTAQLLITDSVTITGKGAALTTVKSTQASGAASRVLSATAGTSTISGLTFTGGNTTTFGGGVSVGAADLTLADSVVTGNASTVRGGGVSLLGASSKLTLLRSRVTANTAGTNGGGIDVGSFGNLSLVETSISGNTSANSGGGIYFYDAGTFNSTRSTISGNTGGTSITSFGGGIYMFGALTANIVNTTISGNSAGSGGGILIFSPNTIVNIRNSTITNNNNTNGASANPAGGIARRNAAAAPGVTVLESTIVAGNITASTTSSPDINMAGGAITASNSLIGSSDGLTTITGSGNKTGTNATPQAPGLAALAMNGGLTQTHALLPGSVAINAGSNSLALTTDQRGRVRVAEGQADIGAFELVPITADSLTTTTPTPTNAATAVYVLTFSDPVSGLNETNFTLATTGTATGTIQAPTTTDGLTYTINVTSLAGEGSIQLNLTNLIGLTPTVSGTPPLNGPVIVVDRVNPTVSITRAGPEFTTAAVVTFNINFSEPIASLTLSNLSLVGTGLSGASIGTLSGSGASYTLTVNTGVDGTLGVNFDNSVGVLDALALNPVLNTPITGQTYSLDRTAPTLVSITQANPSLNNLGSVSWTVTFSEAVTGVSTSNFAIATTGLTGAVITGVTGSGTTYTVTASTGTGNGTIGLELPTSSPITDLATNPFVGTSPLTAIYDIDKIAPTASISLLNPTINSLNIVTFEVIFTESMTGLTNSNFAITGSSSGASISGISGSGTTYTVSVTTGSDGTLGLNLVNSVGLTDPAGNLTTSLPATSALYTIDKFAPTSTITRVGPTLTNAGTVTFTQTFSEPVTGVSLSNFAVNTTGGVSGASVTSVSGSGTTYTIIVATGSGSGTVGISFDPTGVVDTGSNIATPATSPVFTLDKVRPTTTSITRNAATITNGTTVSWTVVFSEVVTGVSVANFALAATGVTGASIASVTGSGTTYLVTANSGSGSGEIGLTVANAGTIRDNATNTLAGLPFVGPVYTIDKLAPTITSIVRASDNPANTTTVSWTVTFSEAVTGLSLGNFALISASTISGAMLTSLSGSGTTYTVTANTGTGDGTLGIRIASSAANDAADNTVTGLPQTGESYLVDKSSPRVLSLTLSGPALTNATTLNYGVVFTEAVTGLTAANFALVSSGLTGASITGISGSGTNYVISVSTGTDNGTIRLNMANGTNVVDAVGNPVLGTPLTGPSVSIDKAAPEIVNITRAGGTNSSGNVVNWNVTFSDNVTGLSAANFQIVASGVTGATITGVFGSARNYRVVATTGTGNGTLALNFIDGTGVTDGAGNNVSGTFEGPSITLDKTRPTVFLSTPNTTPTSNVFPVTIVFSEPVSGVARTDITVANGFIRDIVAVNETTYRITVEANTIGDVVVQVLEGAVSDATGNDNVASSRLTITVTEASPVLTVTASPADIASGPITYTVSSTEPITGLTASDISVTNGTVSAVTQVDDSTFTFIVTPLADGPVTGTIADGAATSDVGSPTAEIALPTVTVDRSRPTATLTLTSGQTTLPLLYSVVFSKPVTGFDLTDLTVTGSGTPTTTITGSGTTYTIAVTGLLPGNVSVRVNANAAVDNSGAASLASQTVTTNFTPALDQFLVGASSGTSLKVIDANGNEVSLEDVFDQNSNGVRVATADFNADGVRDFVVGTGPGVPTLVRVIDGDTGRELFSVTPFEDAFTNGVYVAAGDVDGDGTPDVIITPDEGGGPRVRVFSGGQNFVQILDYFGVQDPAFRGGARAAAADLNGDGKAELIVSAGFGGGPRVTVWDAAELLANGEARAQIANFFAFEDTLRNGAFVTTGDINGDGTPDLIFGSGEGGGPRVRIFDGAGIITTTQRFDRLDQIPQFQLSNFFGGDVNNRGGIRVSTANLDGDNRADLIIGAGPGGGSTVTAYFGASITAANITPRSAFQFSAFDATFDGIYVG